MNSNRVKRGVDFEQSMLPNNTLNCSKNEKKGLIGETEHLEKEVHCQTYYSKNDSSL